MTDHSDVDLTPLATELDALRAENATIKRALGALTRGDLKLVTRLKDRLVMVEVWGSSFASYQIHDGTPIGIAIAIIKVAEQLGVEVPE